MHPKYDVMNMADDDIVLASVAKLYKSEMRLAVAEVERLRAEVEKLRKGDERDMTAAYLYAAEQSKDVIARLKAKVERLTKAGDALADFLGPSWAVRQWLAAKSDNLNKPD